MKIVHLSKSNIIIIVSILVTSGLNFTFFATGHVIGGKKVAINKINGSEIGRALFYDSILSRLGNMSCATCHKQEYAFAYSERLVADKEGYVIFTKRNVPTLQNLTSDGRFFWDGRVKGLQNQVYEPVRNKEEMSLSWPEAAARLNANITYSRAFYEKYKISIIDSVLITDAISDFLLTLTSNNSKFDKFLRNEIKLSVDENEGYKLFSNPAKGNCQACHELSQGNSKIQPRFANNGLVNILNAPAPELGLYNTTHLQADKGKFKIPTLRNIALSGPYMHNGTFEYLEDVLSFYSKGNFHSGADPRLIHHNSKELFTVEEKKQIIAFLFTLTDTSFILNRKFNSPKLAHTVK